MAYEWMFQAKKIYTFNSRVRPQIINKRQQLLSQSLVAEFPEHVNSLHLGESLTADGRGGNFYHGFTKPTPTVSALLSYGVCFYFLSLAMRKIPLGVTYATGSAIGLVLIAFISVMIFKETLNVYSIIGLILITIGVVMVNLLGNAGH